MASSPLLRSLSTILPIAPILIVVGALSPTWGQNAPVAVARAESAQVMRHIRVSGSVVSQRAAQISTDIGGLVAEMAVEIGDQVAEGDALVRLDPALEKLDLQRAEAATREARERLADAERRLKIAERLAAQGNLPQNSLEERQAETRIALATVERLNAEEARQRERVRRHTVTAPFGGAVAHKATEEGEWVAPGTTVIELVETTRLRIDAEVPQRYFPDIQNDPEVTLQFDALPEREIAARVVARVPVNNTETRTFTLRLEPLVEDIPLTPGMSARVTIALNTGERGVVVSRDAVMRYPDGRTTVWIVESDGQDAKVHERQVELGRAFEGRVHILSGIDEGTPVVVRGNEALSPGQSVRVTNGNG